MKEEVTKYLQKKAEQVSYATELLLSKTRDWQAIQQYLCNRLNEITLTPTQEEKLKLYQYIYNQLVSGKYTDQDVINQVMKLFDIKIVQAYEDLSCTREVFNSVININKLFELNLQLQINRDMMRKAAEINDFNSYRFLEKNRIELLKELPDVEENPGEDFIGHEFEATFDPRKLGAPDVNMKEVLTAINAKRKVKIKTDMFEELDTQPDEDTAPLQ